ESDEHLYNFSQEESDEYLYNNFFQESDELYNNSSDTSANFKNIADEANNSFEGYNSDY
ncbi:23517_t:CDS:1, partial [Dentiscutata erythropus]